MDILDILMGEDEDDAQRKAQMMAQAVQRKQAVGGLGLLTGDRVLSRFGQGQMQQAGDESASLNASLRVRAGQALQKALAKQRQEFEAGEHAKTRALQRAMLGAREQKAEDAKPGKDFDGASKLRKEYESSDAIKKYREIGVAFDKLEQAAAEPSAAGDLSLIFSYMKMLDPGSTVREGEFANAQNAAGVDGRVVAAYNKAVSGQRLSPDQRADFMKQAKSYYAAHEKQASATSGRYRKIAQAGGYDPDLVAEEIQPRGSVAVAPVPKGTPSNGSMSLETAPGKVKVSNGAETYEIDADKVAEAEAEGYERVP